MTTTIYIPPSWAVEDDAKAVPALMRMYQRVSTEITGKTRWVGTPQQVKKGEGKHAKVFKNLLALLREWRFDPEQYMRWAMQNFEDVLRNPSFLNAEMKLQMFHRYLSETMSTVVKQDQRLRGKLDLIKASMVTDVEALESWKNFMPDYEDRLLNLQHALSPHFLATDVVFLKLVEEGRAQPQHADRMRSVLPELQDEFVYQQVRQSRDDAIRLVAGE